MGLASKLAAAQGSAPDRYEVPRKGTAPSQPWNSQQEAAGVGQKLGGQNLLSMASMKHTQELGVTGTMLQDCDLLATPVQSMVGPLGEYQAIPQGSFQFSKPPGWHFGQPPRVQGGYPHQGGGDGAGTTLPRDQTSKKVSACEAFMQRAIQEKNLMGFYLLGSLQVDQIASRAAVRISSEIGQDIVKLNLFDDTLYIDDNGSTAFEENGERIDDLKHILNRIVFAASLLDTDGIQVRFMQSPTQRNEIRNEPQVQQVVIQDGGGSITDRIWSEIREELVRLTQSYKASNKVGTGIHSTKNHVYVGSNIAELVAGLLQDYYDSVPGYQPPPDFGDFCSAPLGHGPSMPGISMMSGLKLKSKVPGAAMLFNLLTTASAAPIHSTGDVPTFKQKYLRLVETLGEWGPGLAIAVAYEYGIWMLIDYGAGKLAIIDQPQYRARSHMMLSFGSVGLFLLTHGWGWSETHPIEFNGVALNCLAALGSFYTCQFRYYGTLSNTRHLMLWLLLTAGSGILCLLGYPAWIPMAFWLLICLYPVGVMLTPDTMGRQAQA